MDPRLFESINKINEYVHPNYGSHVVTIRPTQAHALEVIKQSLAVAYEVYFEIDWLNNSEVSKTRKIYPSDNEGKIGIVETLNYILSETKKHYPGTLYSGDLERLIEIVKSDIRNNDHIEKRIKNENFYKPLIKNLAKLEDSVNMLVTNNAPATKIILEAFKLFQSQNFIKMMQLRDQLLESIERYDPISAATFSRAFVEHFAVDKWLTDKSTNLMKNFLKTSKNEYLEAIQGKLAKCLVGGKSSEEDYNAQKQFWEEVYGHQKINLTEVIRNSGDIFSNSYDYLSGVLHGMIITGGDLLGDKKAHHGIRVQTCFFSADAVGRVYSQDLTKYAENAELIYNLNYIDGAKSYGYADQKIANSLKTPSVFKHGKDYFGDGSLESPYKFRPGILYHKNIEALLKQLSFSQVNRSVAEVRGSVIVDKWESETGNLLYTQSETFQLLSGAFKNKN